MMRSAGNFVNPVLNTVNHMCNIHIIRIILLVSLCVFTSNTDFAQNTSGNNPDTTRVLNELVISTERATSFQPLVRVVSVIQKTEIERASVQNLPDLLRYLQGTDLRSRGAEGVQADINILGGTFDQTMILINGVNFTDPQTGHHSLNIPVEISQIERIEILQGPGAWSGGSAAFSGAVNIITRNPSSNELAVSLTGGSFGFLKSTANISFVSGSFSAQAGGGYTRSDGYSENTDFKIGNFFTNMLYYIGAGQTLSFSGGFQRKDFGANSFYSVAYPEQYEQTRTFLSSIQYQVSRGRWQVSFAVNGRNHYDRFELFRHESPEWYSGHNYHLNKTMGISLEAACKWRKAGTTIAGAEYRRENIASTVMGEPLEKEKRAIFEEDILYTKGRSRYTPGIYLKHILQLEKWRFTAGILANNTFTSPAAGEDNTASYGTRIYSGFAAAYSISPSAEINGWVNNSFRNPTFTDLYYKSPTQSGNTGLKPEEALTAQAGFRFTKYRFNASLSLFYRHGYRIIDWTRESGSDQWKAGNLTNVSSKGSEISWRYLKGEGFLNSIGMAYAFMDVTKESAAVHSLYATDFLKHKASLWLEHNISGRLSARWDISYQKREGTYLGTENEEVPYKGFILADIRMIYNRRSMSIYLDVSNLFNTEYLYIGNLPQPGRWVKCGINLHPDLF
jgi:iron complex outermembrane receptor protein